MGSNPFATNGQPSWLQNILSKVGLPSTTFGHDPPQAAEEPPAAAVRGRKYGAGMFHSVGHGAVMEYQQDQREGGFSPAASAALVARPFGAYHDAESASESIQQAEQSLAAFYPRATANPSTTIMEDGSSAGTEGHRALMEGGGSPTSPTQVNPEVARRRLLADRTERTEAMRTLAKRVSDTALAHSSVRDSIHKAATNLKKQLDDKTVELDALEREKKMLVVRHTGTLQQLENARARLRGVEATAEASQWTNLFKESTASSHPDLERLQQQLSVKQEEHQLLTSHLQEQARRVTRLTQQIVASQECGERLSRVIELQNAFLGRREGEGPRVLGELREMGERLDREQQALQAEMDAVPPDVVEAARHRERVSEDMGRLEAEYAALSAQLTSIEEQIGALNRLLSQKEAQLSQSQESLRTVQGISAAQAKQIHTLKGQIDTHLIDKRTSVSEEALQVVRMDTDMQTALEAVPSRIGRDLRVPFVCLASMRGYKFGSRTVQLRLAQGGKALMVHYGKGHVLPIEEFLDKFEDEELAKERDKHNFASLSSPTSAPAIPVPAAAAAAPGAPSMPGLPSLSPPLALPPIPDDQPAPMEPSPSDFLSNGTALSLSLSAHRQRGGGGYGSGGGHGGQVPLGSVTTRSTDRGALGEGGVHALSRGGLPRVSEQGGGSGGGGVAGWTKLFKPNWSR